MTGAIVAVVGCPSEDILRWLLVEGSYKDVIRTTLPSALERLVNGMATCAVVPNAGLVTLPRGVRLGSSYGGFILLSYMPIPESKPRGRKYLDLI